MSAASPTFGQIRAQVRAIQEKFPDARTIGIQSSGGWSGDRRHVDGDRTYAIYPCESPLAVRLALREEAGDAVTKVLLTSVDANELGDDVLVRLAKRQLFPLRPWDIVRTLFQAKGIDARLTSSSWIAEALLDLAPPEGYAPARGGFLDADTVWPVLLRRIVGLEAEPLDLTELLNWATEEQAVARWRNSRKEFREAASEWITSKAGATATFVLRSMETWSKPDALPIGLAAAVVYHPSAVGKLEKATGKLEEKYLAGQSPPVDFMRRWSEAAVHAASGSRTTDDPSNKRIASRADDILREVQAVDFAYLSDSSAEGFVQRAAQFGKALEVALSAESRASAVEVEETLLSTLRHELAAKDPDRSNRMRMSARLVRWLANRARRLVDRPNSFAEAANRYLLDGSFVDWARLSLRTGDPVAALSAAYSKLFDEVRQRRELDSKAFAEALADWTAAGSPADGVLPVERILDEIVSPLAADRSVLVIVIDGMSVPVARELMQDVVGHEWVALCEPGRNFNRPGIAGIPSWTKRSRMSLLSGRATDGLAGDEAKAFAEHPSLLACSGAKYPPVLFHKAELQDGGDLVLAKNVRDQIRSTTRKVVGVVVNAVDDNLAKGDQINLRWSRSSIRILPSLLHEAWAAGRTVVLVSDHGHIIDCGTTERAGVGGERFRITADRPEPDEVLVQGGRVGEGGRIVAPWSELVRYGAKKNGYHGSVTPQEMIVPILVLAKADQVPKGWSDQPLDSPSWWDETSTGAAATDAEPPLLDAPVRSTLATPTERTLFDAPEEGAAKDSPASRPIWIAALLSNPVFAAQKRFGGRGIPDDDAIASFLAELDRRGGKATSAAVARALQYSLLRLPGLLAKLEGVLNVDGYDVLRRDDASDTIELNLELLRKQFELPEVRS